MSKDTPEATPKPKRKRGPRKGERPKTPVAVQRIIDEVAAPQSTTGYNRTYHRHNR